jgi:hypothetical protein
MTSTRTNDAAPIARRTFGTAGAAVRVVLPALLCLPLETRPGAARATSVGAAP